MIHQEFPEVPHHSFEGFKNLESLSLQLHNPLIWVAISWIVCQKKYNYQMACSSVMKIIFTIKEI